MSIKWIEHNGKKILFEDYSNLSGDKLLPTLYESEEVLKKTIQPVPVLLNFSSSLTNEKFLSEIKRLTREYDSRILKAASYGVTGIKKILARAVNTFTGQAHKSKYFDTREEALEFLDS